MKFVYHNEPFKLTKDNFPFGKTVHVVDNYLSPQLHKFWDEKIVGSNIWSKTNQVGSSSKTGLPHHSFWGGTFFSGMHHNHEHKNIPLEILKSDTYFAEFFNRKCETDFGFKWINFDYMGLNSQTQGLDGTNHCDCDNEYDWNLSFLWYTNTFWNPNWGGDLRFYELNEGGGVGDNMDKFEVGRVEFKPNRLLLFDGRIPHGAEAPKPSARYIDRRSVVLRGSEIQLFDHNKHREVIPRKRLYQRHWLTGENRLCRP